MYMIIAMFLLSLVCLFLWIVILSEEGSFGQPKYSSKIHITPRCIGYYLNNSLILACF